MRVDAGTQTYLCRHNYKYMYADVSCDTKELEQMEKEQKALLAFKKELKNKK